LFFFFVLNQSLVVEHGGIEAIVDVMRSNDEMMVSEVGCQVLCKIAAVESYKV
jgi:hypothetical protein